MGFMDFLKEVAESAIKDASRSCARIEREHRGRMSQEQIERVRSKKAGLDALAEKLKKR